MAKNKFQIRVIVYLIIATAIAAGAIIFIHKKYQLIIPTLPSKTTIFPRTSVQKNNDAEQTSPSTLAPEPSTLLLSVPFTPQAPTGNWDQLHNEACEEAVAIMAAGYFSGNKNIQLSSDLVEEQISELTQWQDENFGYHLDTTSAETAKMIESVYGLQTELIENFTADEIKNELSQNHLVIISEDGQKLGNPYYKQPGPIHHMLLIKGYTSTDFITNDSGTKRGLNYAYDFNTLKTAAADWNHIKNTVDSNKKIMIAIWK